ncbi:DNA alkylation repair protein [Paenibacillus sacheonensis]|uniref:DNA alkylation repair protein n=1 Tax=Paenibacillus sacheonensis TaxID=742054 RepID=A0A7X4YRZ5_9BACL|nr:DNA alkylation repair protein [Paenibacillus sacheonensis]MBM7566860.1 3-methyladenine DNA glycosylase AlkD [Paenibacillus sacheonensis]NBC71482.1 DNA alkylation repair protein [Paenibacillus sacheonensis]
MTYEEVMGQFEGLGSEQTKKTFLNHGAQEPLFGVKIGDLKKLAKSVKKDQALAAALYESGVSDAMYLAGLTLDPELLTKVQLRQWVLRANWYLLAETTMAGLAAESRHGRELALEWMASPHELVAACGWSTYANLVSILPDDRLQVGELQDLLRAVEEQIHREARDRVRYTMNGFVISVGAYVEALYEEASAAAAAIGKVRVQVGNTACKVPVAKDYLAKMDAMGKRGQKRKTCIC